MRKRKVCRKKEMGEVNAAEGRAGNASPDEPEWRK
jgi:hypothetical protein